LNAVETFLDITKIESGKLFAPQGKAAARRAVENVVKEFQLPASKKGIALSLAYQCRGPVWRSISDPEKIGHVIFNLVDNALKYTEQGAINAVVSVRKGEAIFEVTDTGMGIPPEDVARLFGKYERGELALDRGGSGLGLYVVKMLTEMQGGRVWAVSPGPGKRSPSAARIALQDRYTCRPRRNAPNAALLASPSASSDVEAEARNLRDRARVLRVRTAEETRDVLRRDAHAGIGHFENRFALFAPNNGVDRSLFGCT